MSSCIVVCRVFLATDQEFRVEEMSVGTGSDFIDRGRIEINEDGTRDMLVISSLGEEGLEGSRIADTGFGVRATISLQAVLEKVSEEEN